MLHYFHPFNVFSVFFSINEDKKREQKCCSVMSVLVSVRKMHRTLPCIACSYFDALFLVWEGSAVG